MRKLAKTLKNKKGFTLVEAIAVVAIMGILATVIGGLVTAGTTAYMRQKENAAAKDLGTIVQNEIKRAARSSGSEYQNGTESVFDNVTLEYRLDDSANKYVTFFYDNNAYDWLDGYTQKYGAGFVWRRTLQTFSDIIRFRSGNTPLYVPPTPMRTDSLKRDSVRVVKLNK